MNIASLPASQLIKKSIKNFLESRGYELYRKHYYDFNGDQSLKMLIEKIMPGKADLTIFDVGANVGQSVERFYRAFPDSRIFSFEPNPVVYAELKKKEEKYKTLKTLNYGVADTSGKRLFFKQPDSGSSSFLRLNKSGEEFELSNTQEAKLNHNKTTVKERLEYNSEIEIETLTIDQFSVANGISQVDLLKIDTQGFEPEVLEGAKNMLRNVALIECEIIMGKSYERSGSFYDIESKIRDQGFFLWDIPYIGKFATDEFRRINFVDAIFVNRKFLENQK
jgi:FkbM family methyltransferase